MKLLSVVGARPQFIKAAVLSRELRQNHDEVLIHTGQHYDDLLSDVFFRELEMPAPDVNLGVGSGSQAQQTARMLEGLEAQILLHHPDAVIVYGDTNSTLAGALAAAKLGMPLAHVEAGLRSYDRGMPEEVNRVVTDHLSRYLFCPTDNAVDCLRREGIEAGVYQTGDLMYDSLLASRQISRGQEARVLESYEIEAGGYYLATVHRQANTDGLGSLAAILTALADLDAPVLLPLHPRTRLAMQADGIKAQGKLRLLEPVGYFEMLALEANARAILTDSGGVQREAYFMSVPCVTLREDSEWPETLSGGWNVLAGADSEKIIAAAQRPRPESAPPPLFGDGRAAKKIVEILERDPPHRRS